MNCVIEVKFCVPVEALLGFNTSEDGCHVYVKLPLPPEAMAFNVVELP